jgi:predicted secreted Zn-dependent protease
MESCEISGSKEFLHISMTYPNKKKEKVPSVNHRWISVEGVDRAGRAV